MKLPNARLARVPEDKVVGYLLAPGHPRGEPKRQFFEAFGFHRSSWRARADALAKHAVENEARLDVVTPHGEMYVIEAPLETPDGRQPFVRSVWIVDRGAMIPRLTTAYPTEKSRRNL